MSVYRLDTVQQLPIDLEKAWEFLSSPYNLKTITPDYMGFEIINGVKPEDKMFAGQIIVYKINLFPGLRSEWVTEITHVKEGEYFIDEQRFGPYALWHHRHKLTAIQGGVQMEDTIHYKIPFGILGRLAQFLFIRRQLRSIFDYRHRKLEELFGKFAG